MGVCFVFVLLFCCHGEIHSLKPADTLLQRPRTVIESSLSISALSKLLQDQGWGGEGGSMIAQLQWLVAIFCEAHIDIFTHRLNKTVFSLLCRRSLS